CFPYTHPRATELLFLTYGVLVVGFVDTTNKLFTQRLQAGDIFAFPKGLVHYQFNCAENDFAVAVSAFGSAAAGTISVPSTVLATGIDDEILAKSFKTDVYTIQKLKNGKGEQVSYGDDPEIDDGRTPRKVEKKS
ncbi:hypothetical protein Golob_024592, partial [Gossypium lobatum]|nr:hypothetical protein [Gossypium lobatum]